MILDLVTLRVKVRIGSWTIRFGAERTGLMWNGHPRVSGAQGLAEDDGHQRAGKNPGACGLPAVLPERILEGAPGGPGTEDGHGLCSCPPRSEGIFVKAALGRQRGRKERRERSRETEVTAHGREKHVYGRKGGGIIWGGGGGLLCSIFGGMEGPGRLRPG